MFNSADLLVDNHILTVKHMKNLIFLPLFLISNFCLSQTAIGIKITPQIQFNEVKGEINDDFASKNPPSFAAAFTYNSYVKNHCFSVGIGFNRFDDKVSFQSNSSDPTSKWTSTGVDYLLSFPLSYRYFLTTKNNNYRPFFGVGSNIYYQANNNKTDYFIRDEEEYYLRATETKDKGTRFALNAELGISKKLSSKTSLDVSFVYQHGFQTLSFIDYTYYIDAQPYQVKSRNKANYIGINLNFNYFIKQ
jgi:hypothetical protein